MHRRSVKAPVHGSITCQRGMDNVAASWWSVTSTEAYSEILEYTRFYRLKISARRFSFNFSFNIFFFFGSIDQPNTTARYCRLLSSYLWLIIESLKLFSVKLYSKICANDYYFENIVFFFFFHSRFFSVNRNCRDRLNRIVYGGQWFYLSLHGFVTRHV